jgi:hypothetical protein
MKREIRIALLIPGLSLSLPTLAGSVLELETKEYYEEPPVAGTIEISMQDGSTRMEITTADSEETGGLIFRGSPREMIALDHESGEYYVMDEASMQSMANQMNAAMQQMQQALEEMPPEQRAMAEGMMKQHMPQGLTAEQTPTTMHKTGDSDSVSGFDCEYYEVRRQDRKVRELCVTEWDEIAGGREAAAAMLEMAGFFEEVAQAFSAGAGANLMAEQQELFAHMRELDGYPVVTREFDENGKVESETVLQSATSKDIDPELFNPPPEYKQMQIGR